MADRSPVSPDDIEFHRLGPDLRDILLRGRHAGTFERIPDLASTARRHAFRISLPFDPEAPRTFRAIDRPRRTIRKAARLLDAASDRADPPPDPGGADRDTAMEAAPSDNPAQAPGDATAGAP